MKGSSLLEIFWGEEGNAQSYHFFIISLHQVQMVNLEQLSMTSVLFIYFIIVINELVNKFYAEIKILRA